MKHNRMKALVLAMSALSVFPVWGQSTGTMDHSTMPGMKPMQPAADKAKPKATPQPAKNGMPEMDHGSMNHSTMPGMDSSSQGASNPPMPAMDHSTMDHGAMPGMAPSAATTPAKASEMSTMDHGTMDHGTMGHGSQPAASQGTAGMDHGDMQMQGGSAPPDARDPHAYSGGNTLDTGDYALPPSQRLRMADEHNFGSLLIDRLERSYGRDSNSTAYDAQGWYGSTYNRLVVKAEGDVSKGQMQEARTELLWGHAIATFWDTQLGVRFDNGVGPDRGWLAFGVQGLAPYWFEVDATAYIGDQGRTAFRLGAEYELLLTQKLILQPRVELNVYGKSDSERGLGSGLTETQAGLRLRYEFTRQFAPYIGVERASKYGKTAKLARAEGEKDGETRWVAGVRFWF